MDKPSLSIIHNLARAGGTVVNKCIGSMNDVIVLSEIHPSTQHIISAQEQAKHWFGLLSGIKSKHDSSFAERIIEIAKECAFKQKNLVIRDWSHIDYFGVPFLDAVENKNTLREALSDHFELKSIAVVRHPVDQWLSINSLDIFQKNPVTVKDFLMGYKRYLQCCCDTGFIKYEDFTLQPDFYLKTICLHLKLPFDQSYSEKWYKNIKVTGDTSKGSRGADKKTIQPMKRKNLDESFYTQFVAHSEYFEILELTNYSDV